MPVRPHLFRCYPTYDLEKKMSIEVIYTFEHLPEMTGKTENAMMQIIHQDRSRSHWFFENYRLAFVRNHVLV